MMNKEVQDSLKQVGIRMVEEPPLLSPEPMDNPEAAVRVLGEWLSEMDRELFCVVNLNSHLTPINMNVVSMGTLNTVYVNPRETMKSAILSNAAYLMLVHNHPSGSLNPSREDITITDRIQNAASIMGIPVLDHIIVGRNPVTEALKSGREIDKLVVSSAEGSMIKILAMAKDKGIPVMKVEKAAIDRIAAGQAHQGVAAYVSPYEYSQMEDIFERARQKGEEPFIIILDNLEDPHNLGAIMRTAECAGAHGVIIPKRRACGLTEVVAKASAGAIEYVPCVKVTNIAQTIDELKEQGIWVAACDMGGQNYYDANLDGKLAVVIGSEGFGISKLVRDKCDFVVSMPMVGKITSLNASNAAAVIMYEVRKQRNQKL